MDKRLLEDFVLKCNQWKYWMSFVACGCHLSRSHTVAYWAFGHTKQCNDFPEWPPNNSLLLSNCQCPKQPLFWTIELYLPTIHTFILSRPTCNTIIFVSTKIIMKLARPEPEHSLLVLWLVLLRVSERGRTQSLINVTHLAWEQECNLINQL